MGDTLKTIKLNKKIVLICFPYDKNFNHMGKFIGL